MRHPFPSYSGHYEEASIFPIYGTYQNTALSGLDYNLALAQNIDASEGGNIAVNTVINGTTSGYYSVTDLKSSRYLNYDIRTWNQYDANFQDEEFIDGIRYSYTDSCIKMAHLDITLKASGGGGSWGGLDEASNYATLAGMGMEDLSGAVKSSASYTPRYAYRSMAQIEAAGAKTLGNIAKVTRFAGVDASVVTTGYSTYKIVNQYNAGGVQNINGWDTTDAGVGAFGLAATSLAYFGIISNPVGWVIGTGVLIYGGSRLVYDLYNEP